MWKDSEIINGINEVRHVWMIDRMPSRSEVETFYGDARLSNAIMKTGGYYYWAGRLGLEIKNSDTAFGYAGEKEVKEILESLGFECEMTPPRHPYDLLVDGCVKIDVKSGRKTKINGADCYSFRLAKPQQTCDVYVAVCMNDDKEPQKIYIIPAHIMNGKTQLAVGVEHSMYDPFLYRWDIIGQFSKVFANIT